MSWDPWADDADVQRFDARERAAMSHRETTRPARYPATVKPVTRRRRFPFGSVAMLAVALTMMALTVYIARPCPTEDSSGCTWYAGTQGDGQGRSFVDVFGLVIYLP